MNVFLKIGAVLAAVVCLGCASVRFNGYDTTPSQVCERGKTTAMAAFDKVAVSEGFKVIYEQGDANSVRVEASEAALRSMTVYVKDHELRIRKAVRTLAKGVKLSDVKVYVTSPELKGVEMSGSGVFAASDPIKGDALGAEIAGSGKILLAGVVCREMAMDIAGSGNIEVGALSATKVKVDIAGSGDIAIGGAVCGKVDIDIAGSGDVRCDNLTADDVHTDIAGSGNVTLKGRIKRHKKDVAGSGKVKVVAL